MDKTVTEWQILFSMTSGIADFYTEDEDEYNEEFQDLIDNGDLQYVEQCIRKDYIWNEELEDWDEDWVEVLYDAENYDDYKDTQRGSVANEYKYKVSSYYDMKYLGLEDTFYTNEWSEVEDEAHKKLMQGNYVLIQNLITGKERKVEPDEYDETFDGEFLVKPEELEEGKSNIQEEKYNVYTLNGEDGVYNSNKVDTVDTIEQAEDRVAELNAEIGNNAYYEKADEWWEKNGERAVKYVANETPEAVVNLFGYSDNPDDNAAWDMYVSSTAKSIALELYNFLGQEEFEKVLDEYEKNLNESYVSYEEPYNEKKMSKAQWKEIYDKDIDKKEWSDFDSWWYDMTEKDKLIVKEDYGLDLYPEIEKRVKEMVSSNKSKSDIEDYIVGQRQAYSIDKNEEEKLKALLKESKEATRQLQQNYKKTLERELEKIQNAIANAGPGDISGLEDRRDFLMDKLDQIDSDLEKKEESIDNKIEVENYHLEDMGGHTMAVFGSLKDGRYFAGNEEVMTLYDEDIWPQYCEDDPDTTEWEKEHTLLSTSRYDTNKENLQLYYDIISQTSFFDDEDLEWFKEHLGLDNNDVADKKEESLTQAQKRDAQHIKEYAKMKGKTVTDPDIEQAMREWLGLTPNEYKKLVKSLKIESKKVEEQTHKGLQEEIEINIDDAIYTYLTTKGYETEETAKEFIKDYVVVKTWYENMTSASSAEILEKYLAVEVRAELDYDDLSTLSSYLDKVVQKYDASSYFDFITGGTIRAYIQVDTKKTENENSKKTETANEVEDYGPYYVKEFNENGTDIDTIGFETEQEAIDYARSNLKKNPNWEYAVYETETDECLYIYDNKEESKQLNEGSKSVDRNSALLDLFNELYDGMGDMYAEDEWAEILASDYDLDSENMEADKIILTALNKMDDTAFKNEVDNFIVGLVENDGVDYLKDTLHTYPRNLKHIVKCLNTIKPYASEPDKIDTAIEELKSVNMDLRTTAEEFQRYLHDNYKPWTVLGSTSGPRTYVNLFEVPTEYDIVGADYFNYANRPSNMLDHIGYGWKQDGDKIVADLIGFTHSVKVGKKYGLAVYDQAPVKYGYSATIDSSNKEEKFKEMANALMSKAKEIKEKYKLGENKITETKYGDSNPDKIVPDAYCEIKKTDNGYYINCGIGTHTDLGAGNFNIYPEDYLSNLHKEVKKLAKERGIKRVYDKVKTLIPEYNAMIPEYNANIENIIKNLTPFVEKSKQGQLTRANLDDIEEIIGKITPNKMSTLPEFEWDGEFGRLKSLIGNLKRYETDLSNPLTRADTITITESKEVKTEEANTFGVAEDMYNRTHTDKWHTLSDDEKASYYNKNYKRIKKQADNLDKKEEAKDLYGEWIDLLDKIPANRLEDYKIEYDLYDEQLNGDEKPTEMILPKLIAGARKYIKKNVTEAKITESLDTYGMSDDDLIDMENKLNRYVKRNHINYPVERVKIRTNRGAEDYVGVIVDVTGTKYVISPKVMYAGVYLSNSPMRKCNWVITHLDSGVCASSKEYSSLEDAINDVKRVDDFLQNGKFKDELATRTKEMQDILGNKKTEAVNIEKEKEKVADDIQTAGVKDVVDTEKELEDGIKKEIYQFAKQQGLDLEKLRKQGVELETIADTIDTVIGDMVSKTAIEFMDQTGQEIDWDFEIKNNDIHILWNNKK